MSAFNKATAVQPREGGGVYDVDLDLGWSIGGKPNGGYLLAILARAATEAVDRPHPLAVSGHFLRPPDGGAAEVRVETVKTGSPSPTNAPPLTIGRSGTLWVNATISGVFAYSTAPTIGFAL